MLRFDFNNYNLDINKFSKQLSRYLKLHTKTQISIFFNKKLNVCINYSFNEDIKDYYVSIECSEFVPRNMTWDVIDILNDDRCKLFPELLSYVSSTGMFILNFSSFESLIDEIAKIVKTFSRISNLELFI